MISADSVIGVLAVVSCRRIRYNHAEEDQSMMEYWSSKMDDCIKTVSELEVLTVPRFD